MYLFTTSNSVTFSSSSPCTWHEEERGENTVHSAEKDREVVERTSLLKLAGLHFVFVYAGNRQFSCCYW